MTTFQLSLSSIAFVNVLTNVSKCKVMHIGKRNPQHSYTMKMENNLVEIEKCKEEKDLGITFDPNLTQI